MADIKRMLRNALNLTLAGCLLLSLAACGKDAPVTEETETASSEEKRVTLTETGETEPATESAKAETKEDAPETKDETKEPSEGEDADELTTRAIRAKAQKEGEDCQNILFFHVFPPFSSSHDIIPRFPKKVNLFWKSHLTV